MTAPLLGVKDVRRGCPPPDRLAFSGQSATTEELRPRAGCVPQTDGVLGRGGRRRGALARALTEEVTLLAVDEILDPTITGLWGPLLGQAPGGGSGGVLTASAVADHHARSHTLAALVDGGRVMACAPWSTLASSLVSDVRGALFWLVDS